MAVKKHTRSTKTHHGFRKADSFDLDNRDVHQGFFVTDGVYMFKRRGRRLQLFDHTKSAKELDQDAQIHYAISRKDLKKAWKIVSTHMMTNGIGSASVAWAKNETKKKWSDLQKLRATLEDRQSITLYNNGKNAALWQDMMRTIEDEFIKHGIRPGQAPGDKQRIQGSQYAYIENDMHNLAQDIDISPVYDDHGLPRYAIPEENITHDMLEEAFAENAETMDAGEDIADPFADMEYDEETLILDGPLCEEDIGVALSLPMHYEIDEETGEISLALDISNDENFPPEEINRVRATMAAMGIHSTIETRAGGLPGKLRIDPASMALFEEVQIDFLRNMHQKGIIQLGSNPAKPRLFDPSGQDIPNTAYIDFERLIPQEASQEQLDKLKGNRKPTYDPQGHIRQSWAMSQALYRLNMRAHIAQGYQPPGLALENKPWEWQPRKDKARVGIIQDIHMINSLSFILTGRPVAYQENVQHQSQPQQPPVQDKRLVRRPSIA